MNISFVIVPSKANADGSHTIKLKITNVNTTAYMNTPYKVERESQFQNGKVIKHPQSFPINNGLRELLDKFQKALEHFYEPKATATEIKDFLSRPQFTTDLFCRYAERYIAEVKQNGQDSYAQNLGYTLKQFNECFGDKLPLERIDVIAIKLWEKWLTKAGYSPTTINIRMSHLKAILNAAVDEGFVEYKIFPFRNYRMPAKNVRDICISKSELAKLRGVEFEGVSEKRLTVARDLFMLSFYCAGINLTDLMDATFNKDVLTFIRKKTARKKTGSDIQVSMTIQPEARGIIDKYINDQGKLDMGYRYTDYEQFRSFVTKSLNRIGEMLGFEKRLMFYSARKTFVQFGSELGIPLYILEYAIGQTIKEANNRPVFNYLKVMRSQADLAIRTIIDYSLEPEDEDAIPLPEWARRR
ncbi:MAG: site-specific integrase [Muribaculum sp.]|nr:site-specific integrase [Muribaculum sp.]